MHGWQANLKRTCASPVTFRVLPENEVPPVYDGSHKDVYTVGATIGRPRAFDERPYKQISAEILFSLPICVIMESQRRAGVYLPPQNARNTRMQPMSHNTLSS